MTVAVQASVGNVDVAFCFFFIAFPLVHRLRLRMRLATLTGLGTDKGEITRFLRVCLADAAMAGRLFTSM